MKEHITNRTHVNIHESYKKGTESKTLLPLRERQESIMSSNH